MKKNNLNHEIEVVDLGLPSGLLWCKCNIGANTETETGKYFMWGDIEGRYANELQDKPCDWEHAPFSNGSSLIDVTFFDTHMSEWFNGNTLKPEYDAATQLLGNNFRMPTKSEYDELMENCVWEWAEINGIKGAKYTSKINGNYIFFPTVGFAAGGITWCEGRYSVSWSSSLHSGNMCDAWCLGSDSGSNRMHLYSRFCGRVVRGVCSK